MGKETQSEAAGPSQPALDSERPQPKPLEPFIPKSVKVVDSTVNTSEQAAEVVHEQIIPITTFVTFNLLCQPMIEHDFYGHGLCRITVAVDVAYSGEVEEMWVRTYAGGMSTPSDFQHFYRGYPLLVWATSSRRLHLDESTYEKGFYRRRLELTATVGCPGIYDVSSVRVSCRRRDSREWEELPLSQSHFVTVIQMPADCSRLRSNAESIYSMS